MPLNSKKGKTISVYKNYINWKKSRDTFWMAADAYFIWRMITNLYEWKKFVYLSCKNAVFPVISKSFDYFIDT